MAAVNFVPFSIQLADFYRAGLKDADHHRTGAGCADAGIPGAMARAAWCDRASRGCLRTNGLRSHQGRDPPVAQPWLVAAAIVAAAALSSAADPGSVPADAVAGHSVGELAAGVLAGGLAHEDALRRVGRRG